MSNAFDWSALDACRRQLAAGEAAAAVERLRQLRQEYPEPAIATVLADALFALGQHEAALACLQVDIDQGVDNHWTHYSQGSLLARMGRVEAAAAAFRQSHARQGWVQSLERGYTLTHDYFSGNIPQWRQFFEEVILQAPIRILEIGSWQGGSSLWLLDHVLGPRGGVLHCVDTWGGSSEHGFLAELGITIEELFDANIARNPHGALVEKQKGPSEEVLPGLEPHSYDLIYIDGAHEASFAIQDAIHAHRLVRSGVFLLFDDYYFQFADPSQHTARAVDFFVDTFHASYTVVHKGSQVLLQRLPGTGAEPQLQPQEPLQQPQDNSLNALIARAEAAWSEGDAERALVHFQQALALLPESPDLQAALARCHRGLGSFDQAEQLLRQCLHHHPDHFSSLLGLAELEQERGNVEAAAEGYRRALALDPAFPGLFDITLDVLEQAGRAEEAEALLQAAWEQEPERPDLLRRRFRRLLASAEPAVALELGERLLAGGHGDPWDRMAVARLQRQFGRLAEALASLLPVDGEAVPAEVRAHGLHLLGQIHLERGDRLAGLTCLQRAVGLDPVCPDHVVALVALLAELGDFDAALMLLEESERRIGAGDLSPVPRPWLLMARLLVLRASGDGDAALGLAQALANDAEVGFSARVQRAELLARHADPRTEAAVASLAPSSPQQQRQALLTEATSKHWNYHYTEALALLEPLLEAEPLDRVVAEQALLMQALLLKVPEGKALVERLEQARASGGSEYVGAGEALVSSLLEQMGRDPERIALARPLLDQPPAARWRPLVALLSGQPGLLALQTAVLVAARRLGAFTEELPEQPPEGATAEAVIPAVVMQFWDAEPPPAGVISLMQSWPQSNPGLRHERFDDQRARDFLQHQADAKVLQAYESCLSPVLRADLFRLAYLLACGGVYADADDKARHGIQRLLGNATELVLMQEEKGTIGNNFIAAVPGHPVIRRALELACEQVLARSGSNPWFLTGPAVLTRSVWEVLGPAILQRLERLERGEALGEGAAAAADPLARVRILRQSILQRWVSMHLQHPVKVSEGGWLNDASRGRELWR